MAQWFASLIMFIGRILIGAIFIWSSFDKAINFNMYQDLLHINGINPPFLFLIGAMLLEFFAGIALMLGLFVRFAALLLLIYMVPATFIFHDFWLVGESTEKHFQTILFLKNMAIFGGLLYVLACGAGRFYYGRHRADKCNEINNEKL